MKKNLPITIIATSLLGLGSLTSCQDEDFGVSTQTLKEKAFDDAFAKQFGKPSADQSWDFYTQTMQNLRKGSTATVATTRAQDDPASGAGYSVSRLNSQPSYITQELVDRWDDLLPEYQNNYTMGQTQYTLVSTGSGNFTISAIWYGGAFEIYQNYSTHLFLCFNDKNGVYREVELLEGKTMSNFGNPNLSDNVHLDAGTEFWFLLEYRQNGNNQPLHSFYSTQPIPFDYEKIPTGNHPNGYNGNGVNFPYSYSTFQYKSRDYYHIYNGCSQLLYSEFSYTDNEIDHFMVIGFEDGWHYLNYLDFDYNDIVLYITGDIPVPAAKRVFTEDLEQYDWDYNDVVFDIEYRRIVLRAVGGTKPVYLQFRNVKADGSYTVDSTTMELHDLMARKWRYVDTSNGNTVVYPYPHGAPKIKDADNNDTDMYVPLNVGAPGGIDMLPALVTQYDPLTDAQLEEKGTKGDIVLLVGDGDERVEFSQVSKTNRNGETVISYTAGDKAPAMIMGLVQTRWPKEEQLISLGYPWFYDLAPSGKYWYSYGEEQYLY